MSKITAAQTRGSRPYQEDFFIAERVKFAEKECVILAVIDGHRGDGVARFCQEKLLSFLENAFLNFKGDFEKALRRTVKKLHNGTRKEYVGSTLSIACIPENQERVFIAILGDSPVIVIDIDGNLHISPEHNVRTNMNERERAIKRGALYSDGYIWMLGDEVGLQLSRALGNRDMETILDRNPEIYSLPLGGKSAVLVASDGFIDPRYYNQTTVAELKRSAIVSAKNDGLDAAELLEQAEKQGFENNATVLLWTP